MNIKCQYNKVQSSESLTEYATWKFQSLRKHNLSEADITIKISKTNINCLVDIYLHSNVGVLKVRAETGDFYECVDMALAKVISQVSKKQGKKWGKDRRSKRRHRYDKAELFNHPEPEMDMDWNYNKAG